MNETGLDKMSNWLGLTNQQLQIMLMVNKLTSHNLPASPKNICREFKKTYNNGIQKSNLFTQIKTLMDKGFVTKETKANYSLVTEVMKSDLIQKKNQLLGEVMEIEELLDSLDNFFSDITEDDSEQSVEYLKRKDLFDLLAIKLKHATECYGMSKFPNVSVTYPVYAQLNRDDFVKTLQQRCLVSKELNLHVLTNPGIEVPFENAMVFYNNDPDAAYRECELILKQLHTHVDNYDNLDVRHLEHPYGFDVLIPVFDDVNEFFMYMRDEKDMIQGGIHIRSRKTAKRALDKVIAECKSMKQVKGDYAEVFCNKLRTDLETLYTQVKSGSASRLQSKRSQLSDP